MADQERRPVGLRFRPTQQELISLLQEKTRGSEISAFTNCVLEKNLYGKEGMEPWKVFSHVENDKWEFYDEAGKNDKKRVLFVVTKLTKMSARKTGRIAGGGTWDGQTPGKPVKDYQDRKVVGYMKLLNYVIDPGCELEAADKGYWYMHEYSLSEYSLREIKIKSKDYVICRIVRDDSKSCSVKSPPSGKNAKARNSVNSGDHASGSSKVDEELPTRMNDQCGTSGSSMLPQGPQQDYDIPAGSTLEQQFYVTTGGSMQQQEFQEFPQYGGTTTGESLPQQEFQECGTAGASILEDEFPQCYLENQCLAPSGVGVSFFDHYYAGEPMSNGCYYDATNSAPNGMEYWCVQNQQPTCQGAENYVQQCNYNALSCDQSMGDTYNHYDPVMYTGPNQDIYGGDQQISTGTFSGDQGMDAANQQVMRNCPGVEDSGAIVNNEKEDNVQQTNKSESVNSSIASNVPTTILDDLMDLEQYKSAGFWKLLQATDDPGLSTPSDNWFSQFEEDIWSSSFIEY